MGVLLVRGFDCDPIVRWRREITCKLGLLEATEIEGDRRKNDRRGLDSRKI
jgi:hypothetical protein